MTWHFSADMGWCIMMIVYTCFFWCDDGMIVGKEGLSFGVCLPFSIFRWQHPIVQQRNVLFWFGTGFKSPARTVVLKRPVLTLRIHWRNTTIYAILACFYYLGFTSTFFVEIEACFFKIPCCLHDTQLVARVITWRFTASPEPQVVCSRKCHPFHCWRHRWGGNHPGGHWTLMGPKKCHRSPK